MGEIVSLNAYREARRILAEREAVRRWNGFRFGDIEEWSYFEFAPITGTRGQIYLKLETSIAAQWGMILEEGPLASFDYPLILPAQLPVLVLTEEGVQKIQN